MKITINNQTFDLTAEQETKLRTALGFSRKQLSDVAIGDTFEVAGIEFIKFSENNGKAEVVTRGNLFNSVFDENSNNFATSSLLNRLKTEVLPKIEATVGAENVLEFGTDLLSMDGLDDYGKIKSKISLPTFDFYRKYIKIFDKYKVNGWWWTSTPESTSTHNWETAVCCVDYNGALSHDGCYRRGGVRPFLVFKSSIFVS